jgi:WD40 repeat protein
VDGTVRLWNVAGGQLLAVLHGHGGGVWGVALDGAGQIVAIVAAAGTLKVWEVQSRALQRTLLLERRYEALDITGLTGITDAQRGTLRALGAIERSSDAAPAT